MKADACSACQQASRLTRIESEAATLRRKYCERDETIRMALLEIGGAVASVAGQVKKLQDRIEEIAAKLSPKKRSNGNGSRP